MCVCVGLWWSLYFQELLLQLHDLPFALLGMIGEFDGDSEQGEGVRQVHQDRQVQDGTAAQATARYLSECRL